jgi:aminopeptidase N
VPLTLWTYTQDSAYANSGPFRRAGQMLDYFSGLIAPFPYPSLAHVESSTGFGGSAATAIFYDEKSYRERKLKEEIVVHRTALQWFGNAVTEADWTHLWLSEGLATYLTALWQGHADGDSAFLSSMRNMADTVSRSQATERPVLDTGSLDTAGLRNSNNYQKSAWVLHQLRGIMGDSAFFSGLRRFYTTHKDSTAVSSDFERIMSQAAGENLDWYFRQALTQPGYPVLDLRWQQKGGKLTLTIAQTQKAEWGTYRMPNLELLVDGRPVWVDVNGRTTRKVIEGVKRRPDRIEVDPNGWWLLKSNKVSGKR